MKAQNLHMETTKVSVDKTVGEIQQELKKHGVRRFNMEFDCEGEVEAVAFSILKDTPGGEVELPFMLPANYKALLELARRGETRTLKAHDHAQARRVAWRIVYRWIQAQMAMIKTGMVTMEEVFLPYLITDGSQQTMYQKILGTGFNQYLITDGE